MSGADKAPAVQEAEAAVLKQQAKVEKVGRLLIDNEASEYVGATLKEEEERLRALRQKLPAALKTQAAPTEKIDVSRVAGVMNDLAAVADTNLQEARRVLAEVVGERRPAAVARRLRGRGHLAK